MGGLLLLARIAGLLVAVLVLVWALGFRSSFLPFSSSVATSTTHLDHLYSVLHPLLMVIGFIVLSGEAILAHRWMAGSGWSRGARKAVHLWLQGAALGFGVFGIWAKFKGRDGILANFYSLHSWMGLLCLALFGAQWVGGFLSFWHRGEGRRTRVVVLPWHVFLGLYTYGLAVVTAEMGLLEKLSFLQTKHELPHRSLESTLVNGLGLGLALLCGLVVFAAVSPKDEGPAKKKNITSHHKASGDGICNNSYQRQRILLPSDYYNDDGATDEAAAAGSRITFYEALLFAGPPYLLL